MAPKLVMNRNQHNRNNRHKNIYIKKLNSCLAMNAQMKEKITLLSSQNKELSATRNNLLLQKLQLESEIHSIKNANMQLSSINLTIKNKLSMLEQNLKSCIPALVTMSKCIPSMLENVHEINKFDKQNKYQFKEKEERKKQFVLPMIKGITLHQPIVNVEQFDLSTILECASPGQSTRRRSNYILSPKSRSILEPYVRLKDVKVMLKNSKTVTDQSSYRHSNENFGEGTSRSYSQENETHNPDNNNSTVENLQTPSSVLNGSNTPITSTPNEIQADQSVSTSSSTSILNSTFYEGDTNTKTMFHDESSVYKNVTRRGRKTSNSSIDSDIDVSNISSRPRRTVTRNVNYTEPSIASKLRRN